MFNLIKFNLSWALLLLLSCSRNVSVELPGDLGSLPPGTVLASMKTAEQINKTFSVLTGVPSNTSAVAEKYNNCKAQLPISSDIQTFKASEQMAIMKLASQYCISLMNTNTPTITASKNAIFDNGSGAPIINFAGAPNTVFANDTIKLAVIHKLSDKFWGVGVAHPSPAVTDPILLQLLNDLLASSTPAPTTVNVIIGICTAILASPTVTTL